MSDLHKILIVAYYDSSRDAAYEIGSAMKSHGYRIDVCHRQPDEDKTEFTSKIQPDLYLSKDMELSAYSGIIFIDDGGDPKACKHIAKGADKDHLALGGYRHGCEILHAVGLLDDKFVPASLPGDWNSDSKLVNAPAVRSDNIVTCVSHCSDGFSLLMVDALGGEIKKTIESNKPPIAIPNSTLIVANMARWPEYWSLAERLAENNFTLLLADPTNIDLKRQSIRQCLAMSPKIKNKTALINSHICLPSAVWVQEILNDNMIASLETLGCRNVNSSEAIALASDKMRIASMFGNDVKKFNDKSIREAVAVLMSPGYRLLKTALRDPVLIQGHTNHAVVSKPIQGEIRHSVIAGEELSQLIRKRSNRDEFMIQEAARGLLVGGHDFKIHFIMRRHASAWLPSVCLAKSSGITCRGNSVLQAYFGSEWNKVNESVIAKAKDACQQFENRLEQPKNVNELGIEIAFESDMPKVIDITAIPDLRMIDRAIADKKFAAIASSLGLELQKTDDLNASAVRDEMLPHVKPSAPSRGETEHKRSVERELAYQGIWPQPDGRVAMREEDGIQIRTKADTIKLIMSDLKDFLQKFNENDRLNNLKASRYGRLIRLCWLRLTLLKEFDAINSSIIRTAGYLDEQDGEYDYEGTVPGPYSNVRMPQRVLKWREGDDWLHDIPGMDEHTIANLSRYHPDSKDGFYAEFDLWHSNDPIPWSDVEKGEGNYPMRSQLMH